MKRETTALMVAFSRLWLLSLLLLVPRMGFAHTGMGGTEGFLHGFMHPFAGWDHLLAMTAVGLWAVQLGGRALWAVPAAFVVVMVLGGLLGMVGVTGAFSEAGILASVMLLGVFISAALRLPLYLSIPVVGGVAVFHGYAHGAEMPAAAGASVYGLGFVLATAMLHAVGVGTGLCLGWLRRERWLRLAGAAVAAGGLLLVVG